MVKNMYQVACGGEWCHIIVSVGGQGDWVTSGGRVFGVEF